MSNVLLSTDAERNIECPSCGEPNGLHFDVVEVLSASGRSVRVAATGEDENSTVAVEPTNERDPGRRHSIRLRYWCELCGSQNRWISIQQHKGQSIAGTSLD